jgi:hypothetical protein
MKKFAYLLICSFADLPIHSVIPSEAQPFQANCESRSHRLTKGLGESRDNAFALAMAR